MNTLSDNILDTIYQYKHQFQYKNVMLDLTKQFAYCGWCGTWMLTEQTCRDCWDEDENTITLYKIHCSRCGDATVMDFIPDFLPVCSDCNNDLSDEDTIYEETIIPKRHHERNHHIM